MLHTEPADGGVGREKGNERETKRESHLHRVKGEDDEWREQRD